MRSTRRIATLPANREASCLTFRDCPRGAEMVPFAPSVLVVCKLYSVVTHTADGAYAIIDLARVMLLSFLYACHAPFDGAHRNPLAFNLLRIS